MSEMSLTFIVLCKNEWRTFRFVDFYIFITSRTIAKEISSVFFNFIRFTWLFSSKYVAISDLILQHFCSGVWENRPLMELIFEGGEEPEVEEDGNDEGLDEVGKISSIKEVEIQFGGTI